MGARSVHRAAGPVSSRVRVRCVRVLTLEFTIEPFVEGQPGPHVARRRSPPSRRSAAEVDFGPFGTSCTCRRRLRRRGRRGAVIGAAFANGATHVSLRRPTAPMPDGAA